MRCLRSPRYRLTLFRFKLLIVVPLIPCLTKRDSQPTSSFGIASRHKGDDIGPMLGTDRKMNRQVKRGLGLRSLLIGSRGRPVNAETLGRNLSSFVLGRKMKVVNVRNSESERERERERERE